MPDSAISVRYVNFSEVSESNGEALLDNALKSIINQFLGVIFGWINVLHIFLRAINKSCQLNSSSQFVSCIFISLFRILLINASLFESSYDSLCPNLLSIFLSSLTLLSQQISLNSLGFCSCLCTCAISL